MDNESKYEEQLKNSNKNLKITKNNKNQNPKRNGCLVVVGV
ncbi:hypothetical protein [Staphylococcus massiliensis]|nr:hypothetical protein [Staphylococcus massiliensis]